MSTNNTNPLALPADLTRYYLGEFQPDHTGTMRQVKTWHLTPDDMETIRYALSFHLGYMEDVAAEVKETAGEQNAQTWINSAQRDRRALRALSMVRHDPDTTATIDDDPEPHPDPAAAAALKMLDTTGKYLVIVVIALAAIIIAKHR